MPDIFSCPENRTIMLYINNEQSNIKNIQSGMQYNILGKNCYLPFLFSIDFPTIWTTVMFKARIIKSQRMAYNCKGYDVVA